MMHGNGKIDKNSSHRDANFSAFANPLVVNVCAVSARSAGLRLHSLASACSRKKSFVASLNPRKVMRPCMINSSKPAGGAP
jgi:hypothetical protein